VTSAIDTLTVDCADPGVVARFWAEALGWQIADEGDGEFEIVDPAGRDRPILFQAVPEAKMAKNRWHLDLRAVTSMAAEVERLVQAGATVRERVDDHGNYWTVLHDPEGNEFCVLRGPEDGWSPQERSTA
jgi:predicted enzyme related to lactoylglutathione lyase